MPWFLRGDAGVGFLAGWLAGGFTVAALIQFWGLCAP
jgi:hypothetical protein